METDKLNGLILKRLQVDAEIKALKATKEGLKSEILIIMKTNDLEEYNDGEGNKAIINRYTRTTIDKEKIETFCEDTGQDIAYFQKITEIEQLKVIGNEN